MGDDRICVGAHDLSDFKSLRLFKHDGKYMTVADKIAVGQIWEAEYRPKRGLEPPHVEDVIVEREGAARIGREPDLVALIQQRATVWRTAEELFEGRLHLTDAGAAYVPAGGLLPTRSTGYWLLDAPLRRQEYDGKTRFVRDGVEGLRRISYVGTAASRATILTRTLLRVSLSRRFAPIEAHNGYWLQLSGWY
jgi:hypothetical protein